MYADAPRVGILTIPEEIVATEELRTLLRPAPAMYQHRVAFDEHDTPANRIAAMDAMRDGLKTIMRTRPDIVAFACTSGGAFAGSHWHDQLMGEMNDISGPVPFITAAEAVCQTLDAIGARRIAIASPYSQETVDGLVELLEERGVTVLAQTKLFPDGYPDPWTVMRTPPDVVAELAIRADHPEAQAVFVSCSGLPSTPILAQVESKIGKTLVTSNVAIAKVLRDVLRWGPVEGFGSMLAAVE